ncbi:hypothetical protein SD77_2752 [Bacillus badius]|uniref:Ribose 5-phosphate isomerase B n=1 Tax=Bacillus badius TaxID=1455 RepID=A0ABR5AQX1_BACBA|nr:hypothetical protein SD78_1905 [Bacillus badius]KIL75803.1 hypothetical protein SD77_2752 [Bacillus badius]
MNALPVLAVSSISAASHPRVSDTIIYFGKFRSPAFSRP